jgi:hypothetical protein
VTELVRFLCLLPDVFSPATALSRRVYSDIAAAAPPILIVLAFKLFVARPLERQFKYYTPTSQEAEDEWHAAMGEKRTHHRDMEKRFLHPALQNNELFTVMVHKKQEALARDVMAAYPWFNPKAVSEVSGAISWLLRPDLTQTVRNRIVLNSTRTETAPTMQTGRLLRLPPHVCSMVDPRLTAKLSWEAL